MGRLYIYLLEWSIFYGINVGKYTIVPLGGGPGIVLGGGPGIV